VTRVVGAAPATTCPAAATKPEGRRITYVFDFASGLERSQTDADNGVTTSMTYDNLGRVTRVDQTAGGITRSTVTDHDDITRLVTTTQDDAGFRKVVTRNVV
jgi:YD repeat-containing protein